MALISCPECKKQVSDTAAVCPGCAYEFPHGPKCPKCGSGHNTWRSDHTVWIYDRYKTYCGCRKCNHAWYQ